MNRQNIKMPKMLIMCPSSVNVRPPSGSLVVVSRDPFTIVWLLLVIKMGWPIVPDIAWPRVPMMIIINSIPSTNRLMCMSLKYTVRCDSQMRLRPIVSASQPKMRASKNVPTGAAILRPRSTGPPGLILVPVALKE